MNLILSNRLAKMKRWNNSRSRKKDKCKWSRVVHARGQGHRELVTIDAGLDRARSWAARACQRGRRRLEQVLAGGGADVIRGCGRCTRRRVVRVVRGGMRAFSSRSGPHAASSPRSALCAASSSRSWTANQKSINGFAEKIRKKR
jgi:hypothetical protein